MKKILTLTMDPAVDKSVHVQQVVPDKKLRCDPPYYEPGGGGINVSRAIRRLGGRSTAYFTTGGVIGQMLCEMLQREGIDQHPFPIEENIRVNLTVLENTSGQQYRFVMPGPELRDIEWQRSLQEIIAENSKPAYIVASGSLPRHVPDDFYVRLADQARRTGHLLFVDTSGEALRKAVQEGVYMIKPNMRELAELAGHEIETQSQQEKVVQKIIEEGRAEIVVVSLGPDGQDPQQGWCWR